jgi:polysaccharide transporter, PST family
MTLIRTSLLNGIAVVIKILALLGLNKVLAVFIGPAGYAILGQFQNAVQMFSAMASGGINTGVTKYTAEYHNDEAMQHTVWRTAIKISLLCSLLVSVGIVIFNDDLARLFLNDENLGSVFIWFGITLVLFMLNAFLLSIINGKKEIERYVIANIAGSIFGLVMTMVLVNSFGLYGALVALAIYQSLTFFVTFILICRTRWFKLSYLLGPIDRDTAINLAKFSIMLLTSAVCLPLTHILIRNHLGESLGWEQAGYWEAMWRISAAYLMLFTTTLAVYYLPKLSELKSASEIRAEILQGYKSIVPVSALCGFLIYQLRGSIIPLLFTPEFTEMEVLFFWQMLGDTIKISSWLLAYVLSARAMVSIYVFSEVLFSCLFVFLTYSLTDYLGLEAASVAHAINYSLYLVFMFLSLRYKKLI